MKKIIITIALCLATVTGAFARHHHHFHHGRHFGYAAPIAFGTSLLLGSAISHPVPVAVPYRVWVPGYYVTNYDAYGRPFQTYIPGHWECR